MNFVLRKRSSEERIGSYETFHETLEAVKEIHSDVGQHEAADLVLLQPGGMDEIPGETLFLAAGCA